MSRGITTHGLALNCDVDLSWYKHITPCGIPDKGVTSLSQILGKKTSVSDIIPQLLNSFSEEFQCELKPYTKEEEEELIKAGDL